MHRIEIRAVGNAHESWQEEAVALYQNRLKPFAKLTISSIAEGHQHSAKPDKQRTQQEEAVRLLQRLPLSTVLIALDETGTNLSSPAFAQRVDTWGSAGNPIVFCIGGSWGLDATVRDRASFVLSLGKHTLPHLLARIVLLEQLYRAETILHGKEYHK